MPRMRWTLDQKKHHVAAWRASGLTREQYCELYDIPFKSLRQWPQDVAKAEKRARAPEIIPVSVSGTPGMPDGRPFRQYAQDMTQIRFRIDTILFIGAPVLF